MTHDEDGPLTGLAAQLPRSIEPPRDLWPAIEARIAPPPRRARGWRIALAAAALAAVAAGSSLTTAWLMNGTDGPPAVSAAAPREAAYLRATGALVQELALRRDELAPETVAVLDRNLEIIDRAIQESRAALAADPANADLAELLWASYERKVSFLEQAARLATPT